MERLVLGLFCLSLLLCVLLHRSILYALAGGLALFWFYGRYRGLRWRELARISLEGVKTVRNILIVFVLIGMLTALWRGAGTVPVIVCASVRLIRPTIFLLMTFLLNCFVSVLTGTSFGTSATMGVICAGIAAALGVDPALTGGAILSGVYFGDRCSAVSTSALLVAELTGTRIFENIRQMLRTAAVPFLLSCGLYAVIGFDTWQEGVLPDLQGVFGRAVTLHWTALLPAAVILLLALFQVNVKIAMGASILTALPLCLFLQGMPLSQLPALLLTGYRAPDAAVAALLDGGGIVSMGKVAAIVCISSSYSGLFRETGLLRGIQNQLRTLARRTTPFTAILCTACASSLIACNQTLSILLTHQLCGAAEPDARKLAIHLEDSVVVLAPLVPWSIAGAVPLATVGAPTQAILFAFFLYLLPLYRLLRDWQTHRWGIRF